MRILRRAVLIFHYVALFFNNPEGSSIQRNPLGYFTTIEQPIIHTPSHQVNSLSSFDLTFDLHSGQQKVKLKLSPNHDIIAEGAVVQYLAKDGSVHRTETIDRRDHKVFMGDAYVQYSGEKDWLKIGWAGVTVHQDGSNPLFEGAFQLDGDHHHIQTWHNYKSTKHAFDPNPQDADEYLMVVWRDSDIISDHSFELLKTREAIETSCGSDQLSFNTGFSPLEDRDGSLFSHLVTRQQRPNLVGSIGSTVGCPTSRQVALMGIATDCTYTASFNSTSAARENIIQQVNLASVQYESSFNITLGIQNLTISDASCPTTTQTGTPWNLGCDSTTTISDRLGLFSRWRGDNSDSNAFWTLMSTCNTNTAVGLAWLGQVCNPTANSNGNTGEVVSSTNIVVRTAAEWQVLAHEIGHTFGAVHDCTSTSCSDGTSSSGQCCPLSADTCDAGGQYIMNPASGRSNNRFSPCSIGNICSAIGRNRVSTSCLSNNNNITTITNSVCGNGIVEVGEECDCGGPEGCGNNPCCNPSTCRFINGAVCDARNDDCCTSQCTFAGSGTVCRASKGPCDPQETCSGSSAVCPEDTFATNGQSCTGNGTNLYCASGECTSRDYQCTTLPDTSTTPGTTAAGNYTGSCLSSSCRISCATSNSNACWSLQSNFIDGTECGNGGRCFSGICRSSTFTGNGNGNGNGGNGRNNAGGGESAGSWVSRHKGLVIGLSVGIGGAIVLLIVLCCVVSCVRGRRRKKIYTGQAPLAGPVPMRSPMVYYR
ncbi:Metallo-peptidase family M12-domain-containing protein [Bisporella sp. PMI_857]|nr:Metallo-peptidase family M12-domain-containing protein [Bisporella sp. PMI_857]